MAESTLSLSLNDLAGEVGFYLGWGRGANNGDLAWSAQQQASIDSCVKSGLRQFYFPPPVDGQESAYDWSFLKPTATLDFPINTSVIPLPDDFGGFEGEITLLSTASQVAWPLQLTSEGRVREQFASIPVADGRPLMAALQPIKGTTALAGQRFQLIIFPVSDQDYTLQFQYYVLADCLTGAFPYALGGMAHAETVLESCLSVAEQRLDDSMTVHRQRFNERLQASISLDRRTKPQNLGPNLDRSDRAYYGRDYLHWLNLVQYNGVQY